MSNLCNIILGCGLVLLAIFTHDAHAEIIDGRKFISLSSIKTAGSVNKDKSLRFFPLNTRHKALFDKRPPLPALAKKTPPDNDIKPVILIKPAEFDKLDIIRAQQLLSLFAESD